MLIILILIEYVFVYTKINKLNILSFPIKLYNKHPLETDTNLPSFSDKIYYITEIELGINHIKYNITIDIDSSTYYFISNSVIKEKQNLIPIDINISTLKCLAENITIKNEIDNAKICFDTLKIGNITLNNFPIQIVNKLNNINNNISPLSSGIISLSNGNKYEWYAENFIKNIRNKNIINYEEFIIIFNEDLKSGKIIIGNNPLDYDNKYNINNYKTIKASLSISLTKGWSFKFNNMYYDNINIKHIYNNKIEININEWLITGPLVFKNIIDKLFFNELINNNICQIITYIQNNISKYVYICNNTINISTFKNITFYVKEIQHNFTFTKNELFVDFKNKKIFLITFPINDYNNIWIFGNIFLYKYAPVVFNQNTNTIGFFFINNSNMNNNTYFIIIICLNIISFCIISFLFYYICYYKKTKRKFRNYEIIDDYSYKPLNNL